MSILIKDTTIVTQNNKRQQIHGNLYIEDKEIVQISKKPILVEADYKIDGREKLVLPGLINTHTHIPMTLLRGYGDDMVLEQWLRECIWPVETRLTKESIEIGTKLGLLEMISSGTTSFLDMYFFEHTIGSSTEKAGLRGFLGFALLDAGTPEFEYNELFSRCESFIKNWKGNNFITPIVAPHGTYTCSPETLQKSYDLVKKHKVLLHMHCSETRKEVYDTQEKYGVRPVEYIMKNGLLTKHMILAHCGWITKNEIIDIHKGGAKISHCPVSNMKMATGGYTPLPELLEQDVPVSLGTDGAASNNSLDMFDTMKFCALIHKHHRWDPQVIPAQTVVDFATIGGARCLGVDKEIGSIEERKKADLILLDFKKPHLTPRHDIISHLVYAARGSDVSTTIVDGKPLMLERQFLTLNYQDVLNDAETCAKVLTGSIK